MTICPRCVFRGVTDGEEYCSICNGYGVVQPVQVTCTRCRGKGCNYCQQDGWIVRPHAYTQPTVVVQGQDLRDALEAMRTGYDAEETLASPHTLGVLTGLVSISETYHVEHGLDEGEWLRYALDVDRILIEPSGIWAEKNGIGARIYTYEDD